MTGHTLCDQAHPVMLLSLTFPAPVFVVAILIATVKPATKAAGAGVTDAVMALAVPAAAA